MMRYDGRTVPEYCDPPDDEDAEEPSSRTCRHARRGRDAPEPLFVCDLVDEDGSGRATVNADDVCGDFEEAT